MKCAGSFRRVDSKATPCCPYCGHHGVQPRPGRIGVYELMPHEWENRMSVPRIIHRVWVGPEEPAWSRQLAHAWQKMHPEWMVVTWGDEQLRCLKLQCMDLFLRLPKPVHRADVARVEVVHLFGGVYVDADMEPLRDITRFVDMSAGFVHKTDGGGAFCTPDADGWPGGAFFGVEPGHPAFRALLDVFPQRYAANPGQDPHLMFGPHCWRDVYGELQTPDEDLFRVLRFRDQDQKMRTMVCSGETATAYPFHYKHRNLVHITEERAKRCERSLMIHLFNASWVGK